MPAMFDAVDDAGRVVGTVTFSVARTAHGGVRMIYEIQGAAGQPASPDIIASAPKQIPKGVWRMENGTWVEAKV
jgi:hypothetical protein